MNTITQRLIYIYHNNKQEGPYTVKEIKKMLVDGIVYNNTLSWEKGMNYWVPLYTLHPDIQPPIELQSEPPIEIPDIRPNPIETWKSILGCLFVYNFVLAFCWIVFMNTKDGSKMSVLFCFLTVFFFVGDIFLITGGLISLIKISLFGDLEKENEIEKKAKAKAYGEKFQSQFNILDGSHKELTRVIKERMNDPESYQHVKTAYEFSGDTMWVETIIRGKNVLGALMFDKFRAKVSLDGQILEMKNMKLY